MPLLPKTRGSQVLEIVKRLEDQMRSMRADLDTRFDSLVETFESRRADDEVAALAAERIRSGAADRTEDGAEALRELGIHVR
jgi:endonuclease III